MQTVYDALMAVVLNPATLKFSDAELERDYDIFRSLGALHDAEHNFAVLNIAMYTLFIVPQIVSGNFLLDAAFILKLLGLALVAIQYALTTRVSTSFCLKHRWRRVACFRTARLILFLVAVPLWISGGSVNGGSFIKTTIVRTGVAVNVWYALGMPLLFEEHLILHSIHVIVTAFVTSPPTCAVLLDDPASRTSFKIIWNSVDQLLMTMAGLPIAPTLDVDDRGILSCERLLIVMHLLFALALPSLLLWKMEIASRVRFVQEQNELGQRQIELDLSWLPDIGRLVVFCMVSTSAYWALFARM